jgi:hypothetical protein
VGYTDYESGKLFINRLGDGGKICRREMIEILNCFILCYIVMLESNVCERSFDLFAGMALNEGFFFNTLTSLLPRLLLLLWAVVK